MPSAVRRIETVAESPPVPHSPEAMSVRPPVFCEVEGRGTRGKTTLIRVLMERATEAGRPVQLVDLDARAQLANYFAGVVVPDYPEEVAVHEFLEGLVDAQIEAVGGLEPPSILLDMNGNDPTFGKFASRLRLSDMLAESGITPVRLRVMGPDAEDAADLGREDAKGGWSPRDTVLVLNHGTIRDGRGAEQAFAPVKAHPAFRAALERGARVVEFPRLDCMADVVGRNLTFAKAATAGGGGLGPSGRRLLALWREALARELAPVAGCLP